MTEVSHLQESATPIHLDTSKASVARVYDAFLGGKDNYEIDRQVFEDVKRVAPEAADLAWDNREFLIRVTRFVAGQTGVRQFLDCGSGLPTAENTHQVAQRIAPESTVVYVDNDPVVLAHGRALLEENEQTHFSAADIFDPRELLSDPVVNRHLDFSEPIAFFQLGTLHHHVEGADPAEIMEEFVRALPSGSLVAVSHFFDPEDDGYYSDLARRMEQVFLHSPMGSGAFRTRAQIEAMFPGLEMIDPGVVLCCEWWPDGPRLRKQPEVSNCIVGGVGRKP
ncbi:SAM-dependent methyltransferase [Actinopolyspora mortivallis]|uniref:SAM-dependent methyltransferase n=1 Tax=Actinopolyspora mortivallis TaxID=33906 RepID=UPI00036A727B|nr:SAM-dependent methyltransferase [Actinopolyspora mortivallis]